MSHSRLKAEACAWARGHSGLSVCSDPSSGKYFNAVAWNCSAASEKRSSIAPDIPTLGEQGYPGAEADMWYGLFGPANLPEPIVAKLNKALNDALADAETRNALEKQGLEVGPSTPAEFKALVEKENAKWKQATTAAGLVAE